MNTSPIFSCSLLLRLSPSSPPLFASVLTALCLHTPVLMSSTIMTSRVSLRYLFFSFYLVVVVITTAAAGKAATAAA